MTIFALTCLIPSMVLMDKNYSSGELYFSLTGLFVLVALLLTVIVMDRYFVPRAPDQKFTVNDIYAFFYDENYETTERQFACKFQEFKVVLIKLWLGFPVLVSVLGWISFEMGLNPKWVQFVVLGCAFVTAWWVLYNWPFDFGLRWKNREESHCEISEFLKYQSVFGPYQIILFFTPFFLGPIIYLLHIAGISYFAILLHLRDVQYPNDVLDLGVKGSFIIPLMNYVVLLIPIGFLFISTTMTIGMKFVSFAHEISRLRRASETNN